MKKRLFCMLLALAMCLTLLPTAALADALADSNEFSPADPVAAVQQMIDALPTAAEVEELGTDDRDAAYLAAQYL